MNTQITTPITTTTEKLTATQKLDEHILVVKRTHFFAQDDFSGIIPITDFSDYLRIIDSHKEFLPRSVMETDPTYKQIIPYLVFTHQNRYFLMQRHSKASETRLQSKFSLGIGGHIKERDITHRDIFSWAHREFHEEIAYSGSLRIEPIGLVNDDSNEVGKVHVGFVFLVHGDSSDIAIKSELQSGSLLSLEECSLYKERMETWSAMVHELLVNREVSAG